MVIDLIILLLSLIVVLIGIDNIYGSELNNKLECDSCGIISREGIWKLHNTQEKYYEKCPMCNKKTYPSWRFGRKYKTPLAPRLNIIKRYQLKKILKNKGDIESIDKQMESYLKIQEEKLKIMKKGERA